MLLYHCNTKINFSKLRGRGHWSESSFFGTTLIISLLAWTIISTVLQLDLTVTTNVTAAYNKSASLVIGKQSLSTLTHFGANWWPTRPCPAVLHCTGDNTEDSKLSGSGHSPDVISF